VTFDAGGIENGFDVLGVGDAGFGRGRREFAGVHVSGKGARGDSNGGGNGKGSSEVHILWLGRNFR
jgi:hypothetical protein